MEVRSKSFQDLIVWQKAHQFVLSVYRITKLFPKEEPYGLCSQFRRAAVSIAANIAQGSLEECRYYILLVKDLEYADTSALIIAIEEVSKLLNSYMEKIRISK